MEKQMTKLGARILSESELNAILPNAESIYDQIEIFRSNISDENDEQQEIEQKTNNIGIMGRRGAGKTSILKTFYENLKKKNASDKEEKKEAKNQSGDIILPIIIPENMSSGTALMDVVLGMLKPVVAARKKVQNNTWSEDCIYSARDSLEKEYNELVKQYCYIKKDYRDILIQQFTTEQNYVDKTKEVFNSDSEFIRLFNRFVKNLLCDNNKSDEKYMIFLFIDDIDLSTHRCMDVVRTLLSYLSNPRIVTFISGDMDTFEEALTLEFLRQEKALTANLFEKTYYSTNEEKGNSDLLSRKKILAYEYLKKIIPPAYRWSIKYWSLDERSSYQVMEDNDTEQKTLVELLVEVSKDKLDKSYLVYKEDGEQKYMNLAFHMFDDTSRGLNNVYNALQELYYKKTLNEHTEDTKKENAKKEDKLLFSFWRLIETIVDSKPLYAKYKSELLKQIVIHEQESIKINFANAYELLYGENTNISTSRERFIIFLFIDFCAKLFSQKQQDNDDYIKLKKKIVQEYLSDDSIDDKIATKRALIDFDKVNIGKNFDEVPIRLILITFLQQSDFLFILHLIRYLGKTTIYNILENNKNIVYSEKELTYKVTYALAKAVQVINETDEDRQKYLAYLYIQMPEIVLGLLDKLSLDPYIIYGNQLTDCETIVVHGKKYIGTEGNLATANFHNINSYIIDDSTYNTDHWQLLWAEYENRKSIYWIYYESSLREKRSTRLLFNIKDMAENSISTGLTKTIMKQMKEIMEKYRVKEIQANNYSNLSNETEKKVIVQIDNNGLWNTRYVKDKVYPYLRSEKSKYISKLNRGRTLFDATELLTGAYFDLKNCEKGSSGTALAYDLLSNIKKILFLPRNQEYRFSDEKFYLCLEQVLIIQCILREFLYFHTRVKYGKKEARQLLMEIKELPLVFHTPEWITIYEEMKQKEEQFFNWREDDSTSYLNRKVMDNISLEGAIKSIQNKYYTKEGEKIVANISKEYFNNLTDENIMYIQYYAQKTHIQDTLANLREKNERTVEWNDIEQIISKEDYLFTFHSYLRYLQANNSEFEKAGIQAEVIATFAEDILTSEVIADERIQNEVYEIINKELEVTEEEFENLFNISR